MFDSNPSQHPIIIVLKDMKHKLIQNLLDFVYIGKTNVNHADLHDFMKIAETLQIKGLSSNNKRIKEVIEAGENVSKEGEH